MSSWNPVPSVAPGDWGTEAGDAWSNSKTELTNNKTLGFAVIFTNHTATTFKEEVHPTKIHEL